MSSAVIIEDDPIASMTLSILLEGEGFSVRCFSNTDEAFEFCCKSPPRILISDWCVPGHVSPSELARKVKELSGGTRVIFISGFSAEDLEDEISDLTGVECFCKPVNFDQLLFDIKASPSSLSFSSQ